MVDFRFNDMHLKPVGDVLHHGLRDHYVLLEDKIRFEQSIKGDVPTISDNTLLATIAALLASFPKGKQPSGKDLERAAESIGVSISDDSIRKALKAAREVAPSLPSA